MARRRNQLVMLGLGEHARFPFSLPKVLGLLIVILALPIADSSRREDRAATLAQEED